MKSAARLHTSSKGSCINKDASIKMSTVIFFTLLKLEHTSVVYSQNGREKQPLSHWATDAIIHVIFSPYREVHPRRKRSRKHTDSRSVTAERCSQRAGAGARPTNYDSYAQDRVCT